MKTASETAERSSSTLERMNVTMRKLNELAGTDPSSPQFVDAAYDFVAAMGGHRAFVPEPSPEILNQLSPGVVMAAAQGLIQRCNTWIEDARNLRSHWEAADDEDAALSLCNSAVESAMESWIVARVIDGVFEMWLATDHESQPVYTEVIDRLHERISNLDEALLKETDVLSEVCRTGLLDRWRESLNPAFLDRQPWWLDGTLEHAAEKADADLDSFMRQITYRPTVAAVSTSVYSSNRLPAAYLSPLAAADSESDHQLQFEAWNWGSPDEQFVAQLVIPHFPEHGDESEVTLTLSRLHDEPLSGEFQDQPVLLGNVPAFIDDRGRAQFVLRRLRQSRGEMRLLVGAEQVEWRPRPNLL